MLNRLLRWMRTPRLRPPFLRLRSGQLPHVKQSSTPNQQTLIDTLTTAGGRAEVAVLHNLDVPRTTLNTLVKRGLVEIIEEPAEFHVSRVKARPSPFDFEFNLAQQQALLRFRTESPLASSAASCCMASPAPARPPSISPPCAPCSRPAVPPSCSFPKSV